MKKILGVIALLMSVSAFAFHPPQNIDLNRGEKAVFVDFKSAVYNFTYDVSKRKVSATSTIIFNSSIKGHPIFDLIPQATSITIDGEKVTSSKVEIGNGISSVHHLNKLVEAGEHTLVIENSISTNVTFAYLSKSVASAFWMSDLSDKSYLEQYLPTNLEYDQYQYKFIVKIIGDSNQYEVMSNGATKVLGTNYFEINFPKHFTASSPYYHLAVKNRYKRIEDTFISVDGREIPILVYGKLRLSSFMSRAKSTLKDLEKDYGRWPHSSVVIYGAGSGGMEYCGATISSYSALGHELTHSYFARGVMPARGNSGWIDEAMASWRDSGYKQVSKSGLSKTKMAGHSAYRRTTDRAAYSKGRDFLGYLDKKFNDLGGLKPFMRKLHKERLFKPLLTVNFKNDLNTYYGEDLTALFDNYIYGKNGVSIDTDIEENPIHKKLTKEELEALL